MSYYQFQGPVQGGFGFGPDDDEQRRRRKHYRDAGAPYSGGVSRRPVPALPAPEPVGVRPDEGPSGPLAPQYAPDRPLAPRQGAAVDLGQGPQQLPIEPSAAQQHAMRFGGPDEEKTDPLAGYEPVSGDPTPVQEHATRFGGPDEEKTDPLAGYERVSGDRTRALEGPRGDIGASDLAEDLEQKQQEAAGRSPTTYRSAGLGRGAGVQPARPERPAPRGRGFSARPKQQPGFGPDRGKKGRGGVPFDPMRPFKDLPKSVLGRGMKEWKSRAPTQGERQKFPAGFQKSQSEEYLRHRQATQRGALHRFPKGVQPSQAEEYAGQRKRKVSFGGVTGIRPVPKGKAARFTPGGISGYVPTEAEKARGYQQLGRGQGRETARREHRIALQKLNKQNRNLIASIQKRGGEQLGAREQEITRLQEVGTAMQRTGSRQLAQREARIRSLTEEGRQMEAHTKRTTGELRAGMGREGLRAQRAEERASGLQRKGAALEAYAKKRYGGLKAEANRRIQSLEKKINDGSADREAAQKEIDDLTAQLAAASKAAPEQKQDLSGLKSELADLKKMLLKSGQGRQAPAGAPPIVVQGGSGGGGASAAGGAASSAGAGGAPAPDLSKIVEAVKQIAGAAAGKKGGSTKGITQARRTYTDKRKAKIAELRALKSKRVREFAAKTKKLPKAERQKQRRAYSKRVNAQFKEAQTRFPTARGLKSVGVIRELIRKIDAFRPAK